MEKLNKEINKNLDKIENLSEDNPEIVIKYEHQLKKPLPSIRHLKK